MFITNLDIFRLGYILLLFVYIDPFLAYVLILYPLKIPGKPNNSMRTMARNDVIKLIIPR